MVTIVPPGLLESSWQYIHIEARSGQHAGHHVLVVVVGEEAVWKSGKRPILADHASHGARVGLL
jgi:hypothetical protein